MIHTKIWCCNEHQTSLLYNWVPMWIGLHDGDGTTLTVILCKYAWSYEWAFIQARGQLGLIKKAWLASLCSATCVRVPRRSPITWHKRHLVYLSGSTSHVSYSVSSTPSITPGVTARPLSVASTALLLGYDFFVTRFSGTPTLVLAGALSFWGARPGFTGVL